MGATNETTERKALSSIVLINELGSVFQKMSTLKYIMHYSLFKSHVSYCCISSWGGVSEYKLKTLFSVQKRCVRLLFGKELTFGL